MSDKIKRRKLIQEYRDGGDGFIKWAEENARVPVFPLGSDVPKWTLLGEMPSEIHPDTNRSYKYLWDNEKEVVREALQMKNGRFIRNLIVLCWMRGEGKSLLACLIQLWKFFCFPRQSIMLGANSRDQVKFVHYDIMRDIIMNSPNLYRIVGEKNIQEKEIRLRDKKGRVVSIIRAISSFSGIVSNITGFTFSEIFDMKNPKFYSQLYGSIRNMPNALGVIDSTVSDKTHVLYQLYSSWKTGRQNKVFFSYRSSPKANHQDYWNPHMTQDQLENYRDSFPPDEFDRYFKNTWEVGDRNLITESMVKSTHFVGYNGNIVIGTDLPEFVNKIVKIEEWMTDYEERTAFTEVARLQRAYDGKKRKKQGIENELWPIENFYTLKEPGGLPKIATVNELKELSNLYRTNWCILTGLDRADPMKGIYSNARTIVTAVAKGLPGSWDNEIAYLSDANTVPKYLYVIVALEHVVSSGLEDIKSTLKEIAFEYNGIDSFSAERWGVWDIVPWLDEEEIHSEVIQPTYDRQKSMFNELYFCYKQARLKAPVTGVLGSKMDDILEEEALAFKHNPVKKWYGSPEKVERHGIQDDAIYSVALAIYGGRNLSFLDFREIEQKPYFGEMQENSMELFGSY